MRIATLIAVAALIIAIPAQAKMPFLKKAQDLGFADAKNCQYCHVDKMPKKGASEGNERGKFLLKTKADKKAAEVDVAWLKEYKGK
jgi:predicted transposase YbfD/YdcC